MRKNFGFFIIHHLFKTFVNYLQTTRDYQAVKNTAVFFGCGSQDTFSSQAPAKPGFRAQATVEYFMLLIIFALLTLLSVTFFFPALRYNLVEGSDSMFITAVRRILE